MTATPTYFCYWAKTRSNASLGTSFHLLPFHSLDVAATGRALLESHPTLRGFLARAICLPEEASVAWLVFLLSVHDLGKFATAFQMLNEAVVRELGRSPIERTYATRHDSLGYALWNREIATAVLNGRVADDTQEDWQAIVEPLAQAVTCHHGQPAESVASLHSAFLHEDRVAARDFASDMAQRFLPGVATPTDLDLPNIIDDRIPEHASWWIAGFAVLCDWLGSNEDHFPFHAEPMDLDEYWNHHALPGARAALQAAELLPAHPAIEQPITELFSRIQTPTPLQHAAQEQAIHKGPQLFLLEDVTGAGKTEAAFVLLHRLMAAGRGEGFFIGLPTMATANAMFRRSADVYARLFENGTPVSHVLAHGAARLANNFTETIAPVHPADQTDYTPGETTASEHCNAWFANNAKKALMAHAGVGTVDQLMLAVLQSKHQSLRLLGLRGKVIVLDEIHAADRYMQRILETLLRFHAAAGGSAVLLSATLPLSMRRGYVRAFCQGLGCLPPDLQSQAYPLLTQVSGEGASETPVRTRASVSRSLGFSLIHDEHETLEALLAAAESGQCACWVRNTVDGARDTYESLKSRIPVERLTLFHARFAQADRQRIENQVLHHFGRDSTEQDRQGLIVIGTQVLQESLDVDFDFMVSDLAPIDLLLQRAGRLRRHTRDTHGKRINHSDQRGPTRLLVLAPDPRRVDDEHWLSHTLPKAELIYPDHGLLWKTAELIHRRGQITVPGELRDWIEAVYDPDQAPTDTDYQLEPPEALARWTDDAYADQLKQQDMAAANLIDFDRGYSRDGQWWDEARTPTRLGEPTTTLRLARLENGLIRPWSDDPKHPWSLSEVRVMANRVSQAADYKAEGLHEAVEAVTGGWKAAAKFTVLVVMQLTDTDEWKGQACTASGNPVELLYSPVSGLRFSR